MYILTCQWNSRNACVFALPRNIDQTKLKRTRRGGWFIDDQVGKEYQLDNSYYRNNVWDRGHLARRSSAAWGDTPSAAQDASDATMCYSNAALQHSHFNQDEWLGLEDWVKDLEHDLNNKICVFSGPIYTGQDGTSRMIGSPPAQIPSAFFKVVCYIDSQKRLATRAFLLVQDRKALSSKNARTRKFDLGVYQVTIKMIEEETGLIFDNVIGKSNPAVFSPPTPDTPGKSLKSTFGNVNRCVWVNDP